jgi:hypothetical protein
LHHAFVDKLYNDFQVSSVGRFDLIDGFDSFGNPITASTPLAGYPGRTVGSVLDTRTSCFVYANPGTINPTASSARAANLEPESLPPIPAPLSEAFIQEMNMNLTEVRRIEAEMKLLHDKVAAEGGEVRIQSTPVDPALYTKFEKELKEFRFSPEDYEEMMKILGAK